MKHTEKIASFLFFSALLLLNGCYTPRPRYLEVYIDNRDRAHLKLYEMPSEIETDSRTWDLMDDIFVDYRYLPDGRYKLRVQSKEDIIDTTFFYRGLKRITIHFPPLNIDSL